MVGSARDRTTRFSSRALMAAITCWLMEKTCVIPPPRFWRMLVASVKEPWWGPTAEEVVL